MILATGETAAATATRVSAFEYDTASGLLTKEIIEPDQAQLRLETAYTYDAFGNKIQATVSSPATGTAAIVSRSSSTDFDTQGRFATSATNALSQGEMRVFDTRFGKPTSLTGPNALTTTWTYDGFGRKTLETRADGTKTKWEYVFCSGVNGGTATCPTLAKYLVHTTPLDASNVQNGAWSKVYLDALNREVRSETQGFATSGTAPLIYVDTVYDSKGRVDKKSRPYFSGDTPQWTTFAYDDIGRVVTETHPDATSSSFAYNGLTTTVTNELLQTRTKIRNSQGQVVSTTEGKTNVLTATTTFEYDPFGNLTKTTDAAGNVTALNYDVRGRKTAMADPNMGAWTYEYDVLGQLKKQTDAKGQIATMAYDKLGRMTDRTEPDLVGAWVYDTATKGVGKLASATANNGYTRTHSYDNLGRPASTATAIAGGSAYTISATYDANGRLDVVNYPSGTFAVKHVYTALGYLQEVQKNGAGTYYWRAEAMNAERQLTQFRHGNTILTTQGYEATTGRLTSIQAGASNAVQNLSYTYDAVSNLVSRTEATQNLSETFTHDALNRLTEATIVDGPTKTFQYSIVGNITYKSDVGAYTYPTPGVGIVRPHAVGSISGTVNTTFDYDANGNMLSGNGRTMTWTSFNMPASITRGASTLAFSYDPEHGRTRQCTPSGATCLSTAETTLYISAFGIRAERVTGPSSSQWNNYVFVGSEIVAVFYDKDTGTDLTRYFHKDHLGSISVITDEAGAVAQRLSYDAWGKRRYPNGGDDTTGVLETTAQTDRGFTGHEHLQEVGLIHMNGRVYDPVVARFMSADPFIQDPVKTQGLNRYSYVDNNPLAYTDPSGYLSFKKIFKGLAKAVYGVVGLIPGVQKFVRENQFAQIALQIVSAYFGGPLGAAQSAAYITAVSGGSAGDIFKSAVIAAATAAAFNEIGTLTHGHFPNGVNALGQTASDYFGTAYHIANVAGHAAVGCASAVAGGGKCGPQAFAAGAGAFVGPRIPASWGRAGGAAVSAAIGGTAAILGGGKFANGAVTAAYGHLFNFAFAIPAIPVVVDAVVGLGVGITGGAAVIEWWNSGNKTFNESAQSPEIDPSDVAGKTPQEIDQLAKDKGLIPKGPDPMNGKGAYVDPVTGKQRILCHPGGCGGHAHVNDPDGNRLDINGQRVRPNSHDAHLPLGR